MSELQDLLFSEFERETNYKEGQTPYDKVPMPPERNEPYLFKVARQTPVQQLVRYQKTDEKWFICRFLTLDEYLKEVAKAFPDTDAMTQGQAILQDESTVRCLEARLIIRCVAPGEDWDQYQTYVEMTSQARSGLRTSPLSYLAAKLGMPITQSTPYSEVARFIDSALPEGKVEESNVQLPFVIQWMGTYKEANRTKYVRGMNKWPRKEGSPLHEEELSLKGILEPVKAQLEIKNF